MLHPNRSVDLDIALLKKRLKCTFMVAHMLKKRNVDNKRLATTASMLGLGCDLIDREILVRCRYATGIVKATCKTLYRRVHACERNAEWLEGFATGSFGNEFWRKAAKYRLTRPNIIDLTLGPDCSNAEATHLYVLQRICRTP